MVDVELVDVEVLDVDVDVVDVEEVEVEVVDVDVVDVVVDVVVVVVVVWAGTTAIPAGLTRPETMMSFLYHPLKYDCCTFPEALTVQ